MDDDLIPFEAARERKAERKFFEDLARGDYQVAVEAPRLAREFCTWLQHNGATSEEAAVAMILAALRNIYREDEGEARRILALCLDLLPHEFDPG